MELDAVIVAPSKTVQVGIDKDNIYKEIGVAQGGCWKVFYKGVLVDTFNGKTKPIFSDPEMIIKKYLEKYNELINENNPE